MRFINTLREGDSVRSIYLCKNKRTAETRNGRPYDNLTLQDKTGTLDGKVWDPNSGGIADYDEMDFIEVFGEVVSYNNNLQLNIKQLRKPYEDEYNVADYMPASEKNVEFMYQELLSYIKQVWWIRKQNNYKNFLIFTGISLDRINSTPDCLIFYGYYPLDTNNICYSKLFVNPNTLFIEKQINSFNFEDNAIKQTVFYTYK